MNKPGQPELMVVKIEAIKVLKLLAWVITNMRHEARTRTGNRDGTEWKRVNVFSGFFLEI